MAGGGRRRQCMEISVNCRAGGGGVLEILYNQLETWLDRLQPRLLETEHEADVCPDG
jgi:hypothetical protein